MRAVKARALRKQVYGDKTFRDRKYYQGEKGDIIADNLRRTYQNLKKNS